ncbi:MAG: arginase family protein, partial [Gemmatimonas sp.]
LSPLMADIRARIGTAPCYLSYDIDSLDPAFAPGTGTVEVVMAHRRVAVPSSATTMTATVSVRAYTTRLPVEKRTIGCRPKTLVPTDIIEPMRLRRNRFERPTPVSSESRTGVPSAPSTRTTMRRSANCASDASARTGAM